MPTDGLTVADGRDSLGTDVLSRNAGEGWEVGLSVSTVCWPEGTGVLGTKPLVGLVVVAGGTVSCAEGTGVASTKALVGLVVAPAVGPVVGQSVVIVGAPETAFGTDGILGKCVLNAPREG